MLTDDQAVHEAVVREVLSRTSTMDFSQPPPKMGQIIHQLIRNASDNQDPYREIKNNCNRLALGLYPELKARVDRSQDCFETAVRLAIAGNIIDFGTSSQVDDDTIHMSIDCALVQPVDKLAVDRLRNEIERAEKILYLGDNSGEIVFDRVFIEELPREKITFAVRGAPTINDATREDAKKTGLTSLVTVIDNGTDVPGTMLESCSGEFRKVFDSTDLVIAKGQGNYETLNDVEKNIFFLFKVKCPVVAKDSGCAVGDLVIESN
jgi:hypothetical protein